MIRLIHRMQHNPRLLMVVNPDVTGRRDATVQHAWSSSEFQSFTPLHSAPLYSTPRPPLLSIPLHSIPIHSNILHSTPLHSTPLTQSHSSPPYSSPLPLHFTQSIPLCSTPLHFTPVQFTPLHSITLPSIPLHSTPFHSVPLRSIGCFRFDKAQGPNDSTSPRSRQSAHLLAFLPHRPSVYASKRLSA